MLWAFMVPKTAEFFLNDYHKSHDKTIKPIHFMTSYCDTYMATIQILNFFCPYYTGTRILPEFGLE